MILSNRLVSPTFSRTFVTSRCGNSREFTTMISSAYRSLRKRFLACISSFKCSPTARTPMGSSTSCTSFGSFSSGVAGTSGSNCFRLCSKSCPLNVSNFRGRFLNDEGEL